MDTKNYNDNTYNLIKLWHNLIKYNKEKRSINKLNSFDYTNSLLKKSSGNLFNLQCINVSSRNSIVIVAEQYPKLSP